MPIPRYPDELQSQGISGWVDFEYVIGTDGRAEPGSIRALASSDPAFVPPATRSLEGARFAPAQKAGRPVRMVNRQRISFKVH